MAIVDRADGPPPLLGSLLDTFVYPSPPSYMLLAARKPYLTLPSEGSPCSLYCQRASRASELTLTLVLLPPGLTDVGV